MVLWIVLGIVAVIALVLIGLEVSLKMARKKNARFDFQEFKVTDVTLKNNDGTKRQEILQGIADRKGEYKKVEYKLSQYKVKNEDAFGVFANGHQIGNIPKTDVPGLIKNWDQIDQIHYVNVYPVKGGRNFGATVKLRMKKQAQTE